jgi:hypothetical protein
MPCLTEHCKAVHSGSYKPQIVSLFAAAPTDILSLSLSPPSPTDYYQII